MSRSHVLGKDLVDGAGNELSGAFNGALVGGEKKQLLEDEVDESTLGRGVGRGLGNAFDGGVLVAARTGLEVGQARG